MKSRILLINFTAKETEQLKSLSLTIDRGYFSGAINKDNKENNFNILMLAAIDDEEIDSSDLLIYTPLPIYEYSFVFINLIQNSQLAKEFSGNIRKFTSEDRNDFTKYWVKDRNLVTIFLGECEKYILHQLGIPQISLKQVVNKDVSINDAGKDSGQEISHLFYELKGEVKMPTNHYIQIDKDAPYLKEYSGLKAKRIYWNNNGENLAIFIDYDQGYSPNDRPLVIILPQFKKNTFVIEGLLKMLARIDPKRIPELPQSDWIESDKYYPTEVESFEKEMDLLMESMRDQLSSLKKSKEQAKARYKHLRNLLTGTGDNLKESVINILGEVFRISVLDGDKEKTASLSNEDIIIDFEGVKILAEVKGVKSENPSPLFIAQVWKHISQNKDKTIVKGALILNHDNVTDPENRSVPYKGDLEKGLEDIIFIDTRVMYSLAVAVIDYGMNPKEATEILFQNGRVTFDLGKYVKGKESPQN